MIFVPTLSFIAMGCSEPAFDSGDKEEIQEPQEIENIEKLFDVPEGPFDLALHPEDNRIFVSGNASGKLYSWDHSELREEVGDYDDIQAIAFVESEFYYTITDNGVTGALVRGLGNDGQVVMTQSSDGTLIRWPTDIVVTPSGDILMADFNAGVVFSISPNEESTIHTVGSVSPETLCWLDGHLYIGGEDGIWRKEWPDGIASQIDTRPALALEVVNRQVYAANSSDGLFPIGGDAMLLSELARPGSLLFASDVLYIVDRIGRGVWASRFEED
ncbi:MAG: hypothetical protein VX278_03345 [Myxococcota bacterium]|nr:hypothetical protein [Myxococcota bacterium]